MTEIMLSHPAGELNGAVDLPASKSESNRLLILQALSNGHITATGMSDASDTQMLAAALHSEDLNINIGDAGTAMRFLTAYYCVRDEHKVLTGSPRMCQRPIGILVEALRSIGFHIEYSGAEGFPPIEIIPALKPPLGVGRLAVSIAGNVSSQYISALLMIAPVLPGGLRISFTTRLSSRPYIDLTLDLLEKAGITHSWQERGIEIAQQSFSTRSLSPAPDWSSAAFWYAMVALAPHADLTLSHLSFDTAQGDKKIAEWMQQFGVMSAIWPDGINLTKQAYIKEPLHFDFTDYPDLAQTIIILCAATQQSATFSGLESLRIKETDRIAALQNELRKFGVALEERSDGIFGLSGSFTMSPQVIHTYGDHRMAMAFAPLALLGKVTIQNPAVVAKSYPHFWREMKRIGFDC